LFATAKAYFEEVDPYAASLMFDYVEENDWLIAQSKQRGLDIILPNDGSSPLFVIDLLHERFN
jgi:hypothetical protein